MNAFHGGPVTGAEQSDSDASAEHIHVTHSLSLFDSCLISHVQHVKETGVSIVP